MKRSGFLRAAAPAKAERAPIVHRPLTRPANYARASVALPVPKFLYVRSPALREAYRLIPCQWPGCGLQDGTVCCAHSNWAIHGKAKSKKASDDRGASLCSTHHGALDQGGAMSRDERQAGWWAAHVNSVALLVALNLWPAGVAVPDTILSPWDQE